MQKFFALFYFEFEGNFPVQASVGLYLEGRFNGSRVFCIMSLEDLFSEF